MLVKLRVDFHGRKRESINTVVLRAQVSSIKRSSKHPLQEKVRPENNRTLLQSDLLNTAPPAADSAHKYRRPAADDRKILEIGLKARHQKATVRIRTKSRSVHSVGSHLADNELIWGRGFRSVGSQLRVYLCRNLISGGFRFSRAGKHVAQCCVIMTT